MKEEKILKKNKNNKIETRVKGERNGQKKKKIEERTYSFNTCI